jgi:hypothetical protein
MMPKKCEKQTKKSHACVPLNCETGFSGFIQKHVAYPYA